MNKMGENSAASIPNQDDTSYLARDYQVQLLSIAERENTILFLPTGSGKTFVAVMLIKSMSKALEMPYKEGGKRTFFAVNTVALVTQQGDYVARHTHLTVGKYSGDLNVDCWNGVQWEEELKKNQVIVLTCQILLDMLSHGFITLENINLIIFDECHHAVSDHCMRRVMQKFEACPKQLQPRVLGLSATLLNSNCKPDGVKKEIKNLETTFLGRVATVDDIKQVKRFSTNPIEGIITFNEGYPETAFKGVLSLKADVEEELKEARAFLASVDSSVFSLDEEQDVAISTRPSRMTRISASPGERERKKLASILNDVQVLVDDLGIFGGSIAALYANILLHRRRLSMSTDEGKHVVSSLITHLTVIRKLIHDKMEAYKPLEQVLKFSTNKVLDLIALIRKNEIPNDGGNLELKISEQKNNSVESKFCCLIFVERRQTAKTLYQVLKHVAEHCEQFKNVKPDFVLGIASNPSTMESASNKRRHHEAIARFRKGEVNYLVASDVMEEGVDIPLCSMVVKLDLPKTFRSYVQSKGRARHSSSNFFMFVPSTNLKFMKSLEEFRRVEGVLKQILVGQNDYRMGPSDKDVKDKLYFQEIPPYYSDDKSSTVNLVSAIPLINRYCAMLPQDKFTQLQPLWVLEELPANRVSPARNYRGLPEPYPKTKLAYLQLPINSPLRNIIKGLPMPNKRYAKRAVGLIASVILHRRGELGKNDLLPINNDPAALDDTNLFPNWIAEENVGGIPGTKKLKRVYQKEVSKGLSGSHPKPGVPTYVYHIIQTPLFDAPSPKDSRGTAIHHVLSMKKGFAILSSKKLPQVCDFSIFMSCGELDVRIEQEYGKEEVILSAQEIEELELFHVMLFLDLLNICKQFFVVDKTDTANAYLIAPTCTDSDGKWIIDWEVMRNFPMLPQVIPLTDEEKTNLKVDDENFLYEVVTPWYRGSFVERHYIVSQVCKDLNSTSPFPSMTYPSFEDYFRDKYDLSLIHPEKPLLEVKAISSRIDCTHPKNVAKPFDDTPPLLPLSKRQMQLKNGDFQEHLIPELVTKRHFPATLWLKGTTLPTILHRFSSMQLASEIRSQICIETRMTNMDPPNGKWKRLEVETTETPECEPKPVPVSFFNESVVENTQEEAPDLDHDINSLCLLDVVQYHKIEMRENQSQMVHQCEWVSIEPAAIPENVLNRLRGIALSEEGNCQGPELADTLSALTGASAGDVINLERLETLGDSFLKFATTTFLYLKFPSMDEGKLSLLKGKIISNRNLYYCGKVRTLGGRMRVHSFAPQSDWTPPGFIVPSFLQERLNSHGGITKNILFQLIIPETERRSGRLSRDTMNDIEDSLNESLTNNTIGSTSTTLEALLGTQSVPDKSVADCVEAFIGAWLVSGGGSAALRLLGWFGVFPQGSDGPAGTWEDLVGAEALDNGKRGLIKDQAENEIIGGVVDWGPNAEQNTSSLAQVSERMGEINLLRPIFFQPSKENDTVDTKKSEGDKTSEQPICDSKPIEVSSDEVVRKEQNCSDLTKRCDTVTAVGKFSVMDDSDDESMGNDYELPEGSDYITDGDDGYSPGIVSNQSYDEDYLEFEQESDADDYAQSLGEYNSSGDGDNDMQWHLSADSEMNDEFDDSDPDLDQDLDQDITDEEIFCSNNAYSLVPDKNANQALENSSAGKDGIHERLHINEKVTESSSQQREKNKIVEQTQEESCPTPPKRRKQFYSHPLVCLDKIKSVSRKNFKNTDNRPKMDATSSDVENFFRRINISRTRIRKKPVIYADFEINGNDEKETSIQETIDSLLLGADQLEECINYKFKNRSLLLQALTHASFYSNRITECYQRLEFLGDAVLDFVITCHIYETGGKLNPGQLTDLRSALVNNITFASLVVRYGLHRHLLHMSPSLMEAIDSFVDLQLQRGNAVTEDCLVLMEEEECELAESIDVPKALGDILESLAGAIFLDSGLSLIAVWQVFYPMMKNEIQAFMKKVPKQPVRELLETNAIIQFLPSKEVKPAVVGDEVQKSGLSKQIVMVPVKVTDRATGQEKTFFGFGERKALAKRAAAKLALRAMGKGTAL